MKVLEVKKMKSIQGGAPKGGARRNFFQGPVYECYTISGTDAVYCSEVFMK
jgi:hypothetical protein